MDQQALDSTVILVSVPINPHTCSLLAHIHEQEIMAETLHTQTATQIPSMNLSAESYPSAHGGSFAKKAVKSKPRFTEFMCSHNEVFSDLAILSSSANMLPGV